MTRPPQRISRDAFKNILPYPPLKYVKKLKNKTKIKQVRNRTK